jgi:hypothetical protein
MSRLESRLPHDTSTEARLGELDASDTSLHGDVVLRWSLEDVPSQDWFEQAREAAAAVWRDAVTVSGPPLRLLLQGGLPIGDSHGPYLECNVSTPEQADEFKAVAGKLVFDVNKWYVEEHLPEMAREAQEEAAAEAEAEARRQAVRDHVKRTFPSDG